MMLRDTSGRSGFRRNLGAKWVRWLRTLLLLVVLPIALVGCGEEEADELSGPFGPGSGGPDPLVGTLITFPLTKADGSPLGTLSSDITYFPQVPAPGTVVILQSIVDPILLVVTRISGRADTPCRYTAALAARDDGFTILGSGDRTNATGLTFHQVNLVKGATTRNFYCTILRDNVGIQISGSATNGNRLGTLQVHYVLNSVTR